MVHRALSGRRVVQHRGRSAQRDRYRFVWTGGMALPGTVQIDDVESRLGRASLRVGTNFRRTQCRLATVCDGKRVP